MSFEAKQPLIIIDTLPHRLTKACDYKPYMEVAFTAPVIDNGVEWRKIKYSPYLDIFLDEVKIGTFKVESEFYTALSNDFETKIDEISNLAPTAISNLNDLLFIHHKNIPFVFGGNISYKSVDFKSLKNTIKIGLMTGGSYPN